MMKGTIRSRRDLYRTTIDSHIGVELDGDLLFAAFTRKTSSNCIVACNLSDRLATVRIRPRSSAGVALPGEAIFYTGRGRGDCSVREFGFSGAVRTAIPHAGYPDGRALPACSVDSREDPAAGARLRS